MRSYWNAVRQFDRNIILYLVYWSMIAFAYFGVENVLINLYLLRLGYEPSFIGLVIGSGQLVWAAFALPASMIGSRIGVKQAMTIGMVILGVATLLMIAAEALPVHLRSTGLILGWMISWIGAALGAVNGMPYLMSITNDESRGFAFSAQQTAMAVAGFAGSVAAGFLPGLFARQLNIAMSDPAPYRFALLLAPLAYLIGAFFFSKAQPAVQVAQPVESRQSHRAPVFLFLFLGLVIMFQALSEGMVRTFFNVYLDADLQLPTDLIGGIMGLSQLALVFISFTVPAVLSKWGSRGSLVRTSLGLAVFILVLAWIQTGFGAAFAYLGITGMLTTMATARGIFGQEAVLPKWRTTVSAVSTIGVALGWATAAWLAGSLIERVGFQGLFLLGALFAAVSVGLLILRVSGVQIGLRLPEDSLPVDSKAIPVTGPAEEPN